jgi:hypothetical protein
MADERCTLMDRNAAAASIRQLGEEDLRFLNRLIIERLNLIAQARSTALMSRFNTGDKVGFRSPDGDWKNGVIQKLNKKTATVLTDDGHRWNVSPGFLSPASYVPERRDGRP